MRATNCLVEVAGVVKPVRMPQAMEGMFLVWILLFSLLEWITMAPRNPEVFIWIEPQDIICNQSHIRLTWQDFLLNHCCLPPLTP